MKNYLAVMTKHSDLSHFLFPRYFSSRLRYRNLKTSQCIKAFPFFSIIYSSPKPLMWWYFSMERKNTVKHFRRLLWYLVFSLVKPYTGYKLFHQLQVMLLNFTTKSEVIVSSRNRNKTETETEEEWKTHITFMLCRSVQCQICPFSYFNFKNHFKLIDCLY